MRERERGGKRTGQGEKIARNLGEGTRKQKKQEQKVSTMTIN